MLQFLKQSRITETPLSVEHVESLLNVLVLDGEIERVILSSLRHRLLSLNLSTRFLRMVPVSGISRLSQTTQSLNPNAIQKANENTDLAGRVMVVREARAQSVGIATRTWMKLLPHHEKRRAAGRNVKAAIPMTNQNRNDENRKFVTTTVTKMRRKTGPRKGRSSPGQGRGNRRTESNLKTSPPPLCPTLVPNPMNLPGVNGTEALPSQD